MITLTEKAISAVGRFIAGSETPSAGLRIEVTDGGCSGYQYGLKLEAENTVEDTMIDCGSAIANYRGEEWVDDHAEGALICKCFAIDAVMIEEMVWANKLRTVEDVTIFTKAGSSCRSERLVDQFATHQKD